MFANLSQEEICELRDRISRDNRKYRLMTINDEIIRWITDQLKARGRGSKRELSEHLGVRPDVITRMLNTDPNKETRVIRADELVRISEFFGAPPPGIAGQTAILDEDFARIFNSADEKKKAEIKRYLEYLTAQK